MGVKPPGSASVKKAIPSLPGYRSSPPDSGVVPFSEGRRHQLRVEASPLAASNRRSKAAIAFIVPYYILGEKTTTTRPAYGIS